MLNDIDYLRKRFNHVQFFAEHALAHGYHGNKDWLSYDYGLEPVVLEKILKNEFVNLPAYVYCRILRIYSDLTLKGDKHAA